MDIRDGRIYPALAVAAMAAEDQQYMRPMEYPPTPYQRERGRVGRNDPCPCGARRESLWTHPHVIGCATAAAVSLIGATE